MTTISHRVTDILCRTQIGIHLVLIIPRIPIMSTRGGHMTTTGMPITGMTGIIILIPHTITPAIITTGPTIIRRITGMIIITDTIRITVVEAAPAGAKILALCDQEIAIAMAALSTAAR